MAGSHSLRLTLRISLTGVWKRTMVATGGRARACSTINVQLARLWPVEQPRITFFELQSSAGGTDTVQWQPGSSTLNWCII